MTSAAKPLLGQRLPLRAVFWSIALAALGYLGLSLWAGWREVVAAVVQVGPAMLFGLLVLSLTNYLLRFVRWGRYLALLDAPVPPPITKTSNPMKIFLFTRRLRSSNMPALRSCYFFLVPTESDYGAFNDTVQWFYGEN